MNLALFSIAGATSLLFGRARPERICENAVMKFSGHLGKMLTTLDDPVRYILPLDDERIGMNDLVGQHISLTYAGEIHCIACGRKTNKIFSQGYCYPCFKSLPECDSCIIKPEQCHYFAGTCRNPAWGEEHCLQDHYVYLANSSGIKVGITRGSQIPTRWLDQGASEALPLFRVKNRLLSGKLEVILKQHVADRTDWRKMLKGTPTPVDLPAKRDELVKTCSRQIDVVKQEHGADSLEFLPEATTVTIRYPVSSHPDKVTSLNFDKTPAISGILQGIKGQYLILDRGVLNIRKFSGYKIGFEY